MLQCRLLGVLITWHLGHNHPASNLSTKVIKLIFSLFLRYPGSLNVDIPQNTIVNVYVINVAIIQLMLFIIGDTKNNIRNSDKSIKNTKYEAVNGSLFILVKGCDKSKQLQYLGSASDLRISVAR